MEEPKEILTVHIPLDADIIEWTKGEGKEIVFPELLIGCEEMLYGNLEKVHCMNVVTSEYTEQRTIEIVVRLDGVENTLSKILKWSLELELYENCVRVRELQTVLKNRKVSELAEIDRQ